MPDNKQNAEKLKLIFSGNLRRYMEKDNIKTADLARALGYSFTTVSDWVNGRKYPRMDKVQQIADYFGVMKSNLTEENVNATDDERELPHANYREVLSEGGMRLLMDADVKLPEEHLEEIVEFIKMKQRKYGR